MGDERDFNTLERLLLRVPAIAGPIGKGRFENGNWWIKFTIDITHPIAWNVVQEFGLRPQLLIDKRKTADRL